MSSGKQGADKLIRRPVPRRASPFAVLQCVFLRPRVFVKAIRRRLRAAKSEREASMTSRSNKGKSSINGISLMCMTLCGLMAVGISGCKVPNVSDMPVGPSFKPSNLFLAAPRLPEKMRRVAVVPIAVNVKDSGVEAGRDAFQPILVSELVKTKDFELVNISSEQLRQWGWNDSTSDLEKLPTHVLREMRDATGCDGVLFSRLTTYRAYTPLAVGWNLKLVDCLTAKVFWSADELFDAGSGPVAIGARRYYMANVEQSEMLSDSHTILTSPRRFAQYTLYTLFATLPAR